MKILTVCGNGSEDAELVITVDILRRAKIEVDIASIDSPNVTLSHNFVMKSDKLLKDMTDEECLSYDGLFIPGGKAAFTSMHYHERLHDLIRKFNEKGKMLAAICAAPSNFGLSGIMDNVNFTCYSGFEKYIDKGIYHSELGAVRDKNIITGRSMNYSVDFSLLVVEYLLGKDARTAIEKGILRI